MTPVYLSAVEPLDLLAARQRKVLPALQVEAHTLLGIVLLQLTDVGSLGGQLLPSNM